MEKTRVIFLARKPILKPSQLSRLSNIMDNVGQVTLATMVLGPLFAGGLDKMNFLVLVSGLIGTFSFWGVSLWIAKEV